jgi:hypothetical protein
MRKESDLIIEGETNSDMLCPPENEIKLKWKTPSNYKILAFKNSEYELTYICHLD